jgi:hypothetical protein
MNQSIRQIFGHPHTATPHTWNELIYSDVHTSLASIISDAHTHIDSQENLSFLIKQPTIKNIRIHINTYPISDTIEGYMVVCYHDEVPWGTVFDATSMTPIPLVVVRIFRANDNKLVASQVTDQLGRYTLMVDPGTYVLQAIHREYEHGFTNEGIGYQGTPLVVNKDNLLNVTENMVLDPKVTMS